MNILPECEQFAGRPRMQAICSGQSGLPRSKENAYRAKWGLPPLPDTGEPEPEHTRPTVSGNRKLTIAAGSAAKELIQRYGMAPPKPATPLPVQMQAGSQTPTGIQKQEPPKPPLLERALNFAKAAANHVATGARLATEEQIQQRLAICQTCDKFRASDQTCSVCGCGCSAKKSLVSKLAWADQSCPHPDGPKWGPV